MSDEAGLMIVMAGLYLYDSVLMLAIDEAALVQAGGRWRVAFGIHNYRLAGREPWLPNPLAPHRRIYRMRWAVETAGAHDAAFVASLDDGRFRGLGWYVWLMAAALFGLLPAGLFSRLGLDVALIALAVFYLGALASLLHVFLRRESFGIGRGALASIAVQSLACPPFAINLVRKLCAAEQPAGDLLATAAVLLPPDEMEIVKAQCRERLDEQIDFEPEGSARSLAMIGARRRLAPREEMES
jgi:hypothetical protein